ncbi:MAG: FlgD immunoglobulin-like domain containing protein [Candidatus Krumholzibacteriia bacterium]
MNRFILTAVLGLFLITLSSSPAPGDTPSPSLLRTILEDARQGDAPSAVPDKSLLNLSPIGSYPLGGIPERMDVAGNVAAICTEGGGLYILDLSKPETPAVWSHIVEVDAIGVAISATHAYVADKTYGLKIYDISSPDAPVEVGSFFSGGTPIDVAVSGDLAFLVQWGGGMYILDVSDPTSPSFRSIVPLPGMGYSVEAVGDMVYSTDIPYLTIVDVSNPDLPVTLGYERTDAWAVAVRGNLAFLACPGELKILDVGDPSAITQVGSTATPGFGSEVWLQDDFAYAGTEDGLYVIDIADVSAPVQVGHHTATSFVFGIREVDDLVAFTVDDFGLFIDRNDLLPPAGPDLDVVVTAPDSLTIPATGGTVVYDVAITNTTGADILATVRVEGVLPGGAVYPLASLRNVLFQAGETLVRPGVEQDVPEFAPPGLYTIRCGVGSGALGVIDVDEFTFEKLPVGGLSVAIGTWATRGWNDGPTGPPSAAPAAPAVHPNPFNPRTTISFTLERSGPATVQVFDAAGRLVRSLLTGAILDAGDHALEWDGRDDAGRPVPSGTYLARLEASGITTVRKMALLK